MTNRACTIQRVLNSCKHLGAVWRMSRRPGDRKGYPGPRGATSTLDPPWSMMARACSPPRSTTPNHRRTGPRGALPPVVAVVVTHDPGPVVRGDPRVPRRPDLPGPVGPGRRRRQRGGPHRPRRGGPARGLRPAARRQPRLRRGRQRGARRRSRAPPSTCSATTTSPSTPTPSAPSSRRRSAPTPASSGPKLVDWDDPGRLLPGRARRSTRPASSRPSPSRASSTRSSTTRCATCSSSPAAARSCAPTCSRRSAASTPASTYLGDDLDLCWRAHVAGARVLVVPAAAVRHLEALGQRRDVDDRRRLQARHRLRTVLTCYRPFHLRPGPAAGRGADRRSRRLRRWSPASPGRPPTWSAPGRGTCAGSARSGAKRKVDQADAQRPRQRGARAPGARQRPARPPSSAARSARATTASRP